MPKLRVNKLTPARKHVLDGIERLISLRGYSPSIREIAKECHLKSYSAVQHHIEWLKTYGYITYEQDSFRTIRVTDKAKGKK